MPALQTIFKRANDRLRGEGQVSHLDGAVRCPRDPGTQACSGSGDVTIMHWGECASDASLTVRAGGGSDTL